MHHSRQMKAKTDVAKVWYLCDSLYRKSVRKERIIQKLKAAHERYRRHQGIIAALEIIKADNEKLFQGIFNKA